MNASPEEHKPSVLVVNFGDPVHNSNGSGEQMLRSMFGNSRTYDLSRISFTTRSAACTVDWLDTTAELLPSPRQPFPGAFSIPYVGNWVDRRAEAAAGRFALAPNLARAIAANDVVWLVLNDPAVIYLGAHLVDAGIGARLFVSVWDTPEWLALGRRLRPRRSRHLRSELHRVLGAAEKVFTISEAMTERYATEPGVTSTPIYACPPVGCEHEPRAPTRQPVMAFAGSLYAGREWDSMLDALERHNSSGSASMIRMICIGSLSRRTRKRSWVDHLAPAPPAAAAEFLSQATVGYLPYPRADSLRELVATTFPSKLAFYLAAGLPILFHGPHDSAAAAFVRDHALGTVCDTDDPDELVSAARSLSSDEAIRAVFALERRKLLDTRFAPLAAARIVQQALEPVS